MAAAIAQTIQIVDRSGKVVSTHKQLRNVFNEAKGAYQQRKAEIKAERKQKEDVELRKAIKAMSIADTEERSESSRPRGQRRPDTYRRQSSDLQSQYTDYRTSAPHSPGSPRPGYARRESSSPRSPNTPPNLAQFNQDLYGTHNQPRNLSRSNTAYDEPSPNQLMRRVQTDSQMGQQLQLQHRPNLSRSATDNVDMDLAYGDFHAADLQLQQSQPPERELTSLVTKCQGLLDEAQCAGSSVKAIISHLQSNPDAMAAVALTLAEISNVASKMAPGALMAFKGSAPAVMALLAAPEFLIAVGVAAGVTIVMFGGYKIIKKIKESRRGNSDENISGFGARGENGGADADEMIDVNELNHIDRWRRGINERDIDFDSRSVVSNTTSVEGEFITPFAQRSMGHLPLPPPSSAQSASKKSKSKDKEGKEKKKKRKEKDGSERSERSESRSSGGSEKDNNKQIVKVVKKPSPLRRMFTVGSGAGSVRS